MSNLNVCSNQSKNGKSRDFPSCAKRSRERSHFIASVVLITWVTPTLTTGAFPECIRRTHPPKKGTASKKTQRTISKPARAYRCVVLQQLEIVITPREHSLSLSTQLLRRRFQDFWYWSTKQTHSQSHHLMFSSRRKQRTPPAISTYYSTSYCQQSP